MTPGTPVRIRQNYPSDGGSRIELYSCMAYRGRLGRIVNPTPWSEPYVLVRLMGQPQNLAGQLDWHFFEDELEVIEPDAKVGSVATGSSLSPWSGTRA